MLAGAQACFKTPFGGTLLIETIPSQRPGPHQQQSLALLVDGTENPPQIVLAPPDAPPPAADCRWSASPATLERIFNGDRNLASAFIAGRLVISGDMAVMTRITLTGRDRTRHRPGQSAAPNVSQPTSQ